MSTADRPAWAQALGILFAAWMSLLAACGGGGGSSGGTTPVSITTQPASQTVVVGAAASFSVTAAGDSPAYQWRRSTDSGTTWVDIAGATSSTYAIAVVDASMNGQQFRVVVSNSSNSVTSSAATLTATPSVVAPSISVQPADTTVVAGAAASFRVTAAGTSPAYRWQSSPDGSSWTDVAGATASTFSLGATTLSDNGKRYRVVVSNSASSVTSNAALLTVNAAPLAPLISTQPLAASVTAPQTASFSVVASGTPTPSYQWQLSSNGGGSYGDIGGATGSSYTTPATTLADSGALFRVRVYNTAGSLFSNAVALTASPTPVAPAITTQPASLLVTAPTTASFTVAASGTPTPTLQWQVSTDAGVSFSNINGANAGTYTTPATSIADHGKQFRAVASNSAGSATSNPATLSVSGGILSGTGATGRPIVGGTVQVICASGSAPPSTTTDANGSWQVTLTGQTLPCAVRVSGGTVRGVANATSYLSVATAAGTANVTPLTDLLVANLVGNANTSAWFSSLSTSSAPLAAITVTQVNSALARMAAALPGLMPLATTPPITTAFAPLAGNVSDDMLTALAQAITNSGVGYPSLLTAASAPAFSAPAAGFGTALTAAYASAANLSAPTGAGGSNIAGLAGTSLVVQAGSGTFNGTTFINASSYLFAFDGMGTTPTVPYAEFTGSVFLGVAVADRNGTLWGTRNTLAAGDGWQITSAIVKWVGSAPNLTPTTVISLPANVSVNSMAFDASGNLWVDVIDLNPPNTGAARIVQYLAASGYQTTGVVIPYSGNGGWAGGCEGAALAFSFDGHLHSIESYSNGAGNCIMRAREYTAAGVAVPSRYFPAGYTGSDLGAQVAIDAAGNLWAFSDAVGCTSAALSSCAQLPSIRKISPSGVVLQAIPLNSVQQPGKPAFDANGNLWFGGNVTNIKYCSNTMTQYIYELAAGASAPTVAFSHTTSCTSPFSYFFGVTVSPRPANLP